jgi:hypothetical protein
MPDRQALLHATTSGTFFDAPGGTVGRENRSMFNLEWLRARGVSRGEPGSSGGRGRRLAVLGLLFASGLLQTGCQSGPSGCNSGLFGPCGFVARTTNRLMRPFRHGEAACGSECVSEGGCVSSGLPVEGMAPGVVAPPGVVVAPGAIPSNQLSAPAEAPSNLEPLPRSDVGPPPSGTSRRTPSATGTKTNSSYETQRPDYRSTRSRGENLAHTLTSAPVPVARSAQEVPASRSSPGPRDAADEGGESVLDHLPPLDLPAEVTEKTATPPVAPAAVRKPQTSPAPAPSAASDQPVGRSAVPDKLSVAGSLQPAPEPTQPSGGAPGIARFAAVDLKLAGGSVPSAAGLDWLEEKGYRTLVDLREPSETDAMFIAEATRRNFRYIALPITLKTIDREHLARFNFELALSDARPLYFFDRDGARAGTMWYLRRITVDRINTEIARREAEELGLSEPAYWAAAANVLSRPEIPRGQRPATAEAVNPAVPTTDRQDSATLPSLDLPRTSSTAPARKPTTQAQVEAETPGATTSLRASAPQPSAVADPPSWISFATLLMTGLSFPLASWSRAAAPTILAWTRASLPTPARRPKLLPPATDA